ncbi:MAG TPA: fibronectin type III domain-containing protein, partial [Pyrinomonadaceae bacterium]|nr:fibronectin type III domain-containing protein [Pyrinomonadaceae bacterium]
MNKEHGLQRAFFFRARTFSKHIVAPLALALLAVSISGAPVFAAPKTLKFTQLYATAETNTSAAVVWNTNVASDSRVQYSTTNPVPASAPNLYSATQVTYHEFALDGLTPGTLYFYKVTSCAKRTCVTATGSFETYPSCPDVVAPVSGSWQRALSPNVSGSALVTNQLLGVDALSDSDVWAVGWSQDPNGPPYAKRTLIQHFDGSSWNIVPSPNPLSDTQSVLNSVSGTSANDVWAVGSTHDGTFPGRTLIQHWDGTEWR